jgi:hypothetical protein
MRYALGAAIAAATFGLSMSLATAEPVHYAGGPIQEGHLCWTSTQGDNGFGYWHECESVVHIVHHKRVH